MSLNRKSKGRRRLIREKLAPYVMIAPAMAFLLVFTFYPMVNLVYLSFFDYNLVNPVKKFVGWRNYKTLLFVKREIQIALQKKAVYTLSVVFPYSAVACVCSLVPER